MEISFFLIGVLSGNISVITITGKVEEEELFR
jgi:hypothetical protein